MSVYSWVSLLILILTVLSVFVSCSDEELEDYKALLYLPIAPEVEDPEENPFGPPPDATVQTAAPEDALAGGDKKQRQPSSEGGPAKKKARTTTIELQGVPSDGETLQIHNVGVGVGFMYWEHFSDVQVLYFPQLQEIRNSLVQETKLYL